MFWVMMVMIPVALLIGVVSGMREGSRADRTLSVLSIATTSTPEYVSGVVLSIIFATWLGWRKPKHAMAFAPLVSPHHAAAAFSFGW